MRHGHVWLAAAGAAWLLALPRGASAQAPSQLAPEFTNQATKALVEGKFEEALVKADAALKADPHAPWAHYARAEALVSLKRHDEAVPSYEAAESKLPEPDIRGRALAVWGRASSLRQDGRCEDAKKAFADYGAMMKPIDAQAAEQAQPFVGACQSAGEIAAKTPTEPARPAVEATPAAQPLRAAAEPPRPAIEPTRAAPEASRRVSAPIKPVVQWFQPVDEPIKPAAEPTKPAAEPIKPAAEPTKPAAEPVRAGPEPAREPRARSAFSNPPSLPPVAAPGSSTEPPPVAGLPLPEDAVKRAASEPPPPPPPIKR